MPEEGWWSTFFDPQSALRTLSIGGSNQDIVEFGCGYGTFTIPAARLTAGTVYALDIEPAMVDLVRDKCRSLGIGNVKAVLRDFIATGTGLPDGSVDAALLFNILHHDEPVALLQEALTALKPGGIAVVVHWNYDASTPRGPAMEIRPRPEQCISWGREAGFSFCESERFDLKPYHYGLLFRKL